MLLTSDLINRKSYQGIRSGILIRDYIIRDSIMKLENLKTRYLHRKNMQLFKLNKEQTFATCTELGAEEVQVAPSTQLLQVEQELLPCSPDLSCGAVVSIPARAAPSSLVFVAGKGGTGTGRLQAPAAHPHPHPRAAAPLNLT